MKSLFLLQKFVSQYDKMVNSPYNIGDELLYPVEVDLIALFGSNPDIGVAVISEKLNVTKSAVSQKIDRLCEKGYLVFMEKQGRNKYYRLTDKGKEVHQIHTMLSKKTIEELTDVFSALNENEQAVFEMVMERLIQIMNGLDYQKELNEVTRHV